MQSFLQNKNQIYLILISILIIFGLYLCFIGGYGSDEDTLPMIYVFEARLADGRFVSSRFTSYPIPEIGLGFLSYFLGSWAANTTTFIFHLIGLVFIFLAFEDKFELNKFYLFFLLSLSSPILFFENLEPMDYSWAFLFFSIGLYFYSKKIFEIAVLGFAFAVGCRLNFIIFVVLAIFFYRHSIKINYQKKIIIFLCSFISSGLFYLPVWFDNSFGLNWITAARPIEQGILGLFSRFTYKTWLAFGLIQFLILIYSFYKLYRSSTELNKQRVFIILIISNLLLFFYIPAELSYLQPAIIFTYLVLVKTLNKKLISILIFLNFISWTINFQILQIEYKDNSVCAPKHAIAASFKFNILDGAVKNFFESRKMIECWINDSTERGKRILKGKSTRVH